jgi:putative Mn2+ efflux pump MntP
MDAFAVSVSNAICFPEGGGKRALGSALVFGVFQAMMPVLGYFAGRSLSEALARVDHWIALLLLAGIGGKMIFDAAGEIRNPAACPRQADLTPGFCSFRPSPPASTRWPWASASP